MKIVAVAAVVLLTAGNSAGSRAQSLPNKVTLSGTEYGGAIAATWKLERQDGSEVFVGTSELPGIRLSARAAAAIHGTYFFAHRYKTQDGNICNFYSDNIKYRVDDLGVFQSFVVIGQYTCINGGPYEFSLLGRKSD